MTNLADTALARISDAKRARANVSIVDSPGATVIVITAAPSAEGPSDLLPLADAAVYCGTTPRRLNDARRLRELTAYNGQRDRAFRRADLDKWIESRKAPVHAAVDDRDIDRRMARLAANGGAR